MSLLTQIQGEWRSNSRLRWGIWVAISVVIVELLLRWQDAAKKSELELAALLSETQSLGSQQKDEKENVARLEKLKSELMQARRALATVSTEAFGQARLRDDIAELFVAQKLEAPVINLLAPTAPVGADPASAAVGDAQLKVFRASVVFRFSPEALEQLLRAIEEPNSFVSVEALQVRAGERRADMTLSQIMRVESGRKP
jgi:hypothetical protein